MVQIATHIQSEIERLAPKYQRPGPRYTSYPTAPHLSETFSKEQFEAQCAKADQRDLPLSLYVHVPFCRSICYYCACNKVVTRKTGVGQEYLAALTREIKRYRDWGLNQRVVTQLHWGGGTPTYLSDAELTQLMHLIARNYQLTDSPDREYSIEIDPRTVSAQTIALLRGLGFNRLSLGIQDFDPLVQKAINRTQPYGLVADLTNTIREHGFHSLSYDLIYGLPHQSEASFSKTLAKVIQLAPDRIACYNYAHLPNRFPSQRAIDRLTLPSAAQRLRLQRLIDTTLEESGYVLIGLDHYVKTTDELALAQRDGRLQRNFQGYSLKSAEDMMGIGHSAISQIGDMVVQNARTLDDYLAKTQANESPISRGLKLTKDDLLRRDIIMDICCKLEFSLTDICERYQCQADSYLKKEIQDLQEFIADGLITETQSGYRLTTIGRHFLRNICMVFDAWLEQTPVDIKYSKTV
jgi:oxygen-independent coproporphyrinogen-3 oxidase